MDDVERDELVLCIEAGANARRAGLQHEDNPYLAGLKQRYDAGLATAADLARCDAWWDGWEEVNRKLTPTPKGRLGRLL